MESGGAEPQAEENIEHDAMGTIFLFGVHDDDSEPEYEDEEEDLRLVVKKSIRVSTSGYRVRAENEEEAAGTSFKGEAQVSCGTLHIKAARDRPIRVLGEGITTLVTDTLTLEVEEDDEEEDAASRVGVELVGQQKDYKVRALPLRDSSAAAPSPRYASV